MANYTIQKYSNAPGFANTSSITLHNLFTFDGYEINGVSDYTAMFEVIVMSTSGGSVNSGAARRTFSYTQSGTNPPVINTTGTLENLGAPLSDLLLHVDTSTGEYLVRLATTSATSMNWLIYVTAIAYYDP